MSVIRWPATGSTGASTTGSAAVAHRIDALLRVNSYFAIGPEEINWRFSRSSGPGGQGVNTTDSRVELSWLPARSPALAQLSEHLQTRLTEALAPVLVHGVLVITASESRAQLRNREAARRRLILVLQDALQSPKAKRRKSKPTRSSIERRLAGKKARSAVKSSRGRPQQD